MSSEPRIRQVLFNLGKNRKYLFDVNQNITIHTLKKMIKAGANLGKVNLRIFHNGIEYTDKETSNLDELFPNLQKIDFITQITYDNVEDLDYLIKLKLKNYCQLHNGKFPYFYCYNCQKSICSNCLKEGNHIGHNIKEKYDYLQNSRHLIEMLFYDLKDILDKAKNLNEKSIQELKNKVNVDFLKLIEMIKSIQNKMNYIIDFYLLKENGNFKTMQNNVILLKNNCAEGLDKLKSEIEIEDMMINEDIFLTFDKKFKEIASEKNKFENDVEQFKKYSETINLIKNYIDKSYDEIYNFLNNYVTDPRLNNIQNKINNQNIDEVNKNRIFDILFKDVKIKNNNNSSINNNYYNNNYYNNNSQNNNLNNSENNIENTNNQNNNFQSSYQQPKFKVTTNNLENQYNDDLKNIKNQSENTKNNESTIILNQNSSIKKNNDSYQSNNSNTKSFENDPKNQNTERKLLEKFKTNMNNNSKEAEMKNNIDNITIDYTGKKTYLEEEEEGTNEKKKLEIEAHHQYQTNKSLIKVGNVIPNTKYIIIYNSIKNIIRRRTLDFPIFSDGIKNFLKECAWVNFKNKVYITGGENENNIVSNTFFIYDTIKSQLIRGANLINPHLSHTLIANDNYIYSIGGRDKNCEKFSFKNNIWSLLPPLIYIQQYPILYIYQNYLYSFFGLNENNEITDIIQRINLNNPNGKWEEFPYIRNGIDCKFYNSGIVTINDDEIYFLGGIDNNGLRNNVIHFNFKNKTFNKDLLILEEKVAFKESFLLKIKKDIYGNVSIGEHNPFLQIEFNI